jgi:hypothetical protein
MSVMFEILERLERKGEEAANESVSKAWSTIQDATSTESVCLPSKPEPLVTKAAAAVSCDLNNLSRIPFSGQPGSLLDIRFDPETPKVPGRTRKPPRSSSKSVNQAAESPAPGTSRDTSQEPSGDFPSLWAMARLCNKRSRMRGKTL